jgi:murein DD-endopeptidase MepM/ murein hydrolase activator NlpD
MTKRYAIILLAILALVAASLACQGAEATQEVADYSLSGMYPPYWICASATPPPTPTTAPRPTFLPTLTPWEPTSPPPHPTPTPYYHYGEFYFNQHVWIPTSAGGPLRVVMGPEGVQPAPELSGLVEGRDNCWRYGFQVTSFADDPVDFPLHTLAFVSGAGSQIFGPTDAILTAACDEGDCTSTIEPGQVVGMEAPICMPSNVDHLPVGLMTDIYGTQTGTASGATDAGAGADSAVYFKGALDPECSAIAPGRNNVPWPEVQNPPFPPQTVPFATGSMGGPLGGHPVDYLNCNGNGITRGFGCSSFPTGVSGAGRCPADRPYWHTGVDYSCVTGTPIYHVGPGGVIQTWGPRGGYGLCTVVHIEAYDFFYAHQAYMQGSEDCNASAGTCASGAFVGPVGSTGWSTGPHLHYEIRVNQVPVDPFGYVGASAPKGPGLAAPAPLTTTQATPAPAPTWAPSPVRFMVRFADGAAVSGDFGVRIFDIEGAFVGEHTFHTDGQLALDLEPGVYSFEFFGSLADGTPLAAAGARAKLAAEAQVDEYLYGPLAFYHAGGEGSTVAVALVDDGGAAQPYLDASAGQGEPVPLIPDVPTTTTTTATAPTSAAPLASPTPAPTIQVDDGGVSIKLGTPDVATVVQSLLCVAVCVAAFALGIWLRSRRRRSTTNHPPVTPGSKEDGIDACK